MNTPELKPIDARVMKPGDPVVNGYREPIAHGYLVEYNPTVDPSVSTVIRWRTGSITTCYPNGRYGEFVPPGIFFPPDPDPIDPSPGNVARLRKSQVGEGWRIPAHGEQPDKRARVWRIGDARWDSRGMDLGCAYKPHRTYRVPVAPIHIVPLSMEDFVGKPWPLVRGKCGQAIRAVQAVEAFGISIACRRDPISWDKLRELHELSHDHGVTWVKAEKAEQA